MRNSFAGRSYRDFCVIPSAFTTIVPTTPLWDWIRFMVSSTSCAWKTYVFHERSCKKFRDLSYVPFFRERSFEGYDHNLQCKTIKCAVLQIADLFCTFLRGAFEDHHPFMRDYALRHISHKYIKCITFSCVLDRTWRCKSFYPPSDTSLAWSELRAWCHHLLRSAR